MVTPPMLPDPVAVQRLLDRQPVEAHLVELHAAIDVLWKEGLNDREISRHLGCSDRTVLRHRLARGQASNHHTQAPLDADALLALHAEGLNDVQIAGRLSRSPWAVRRARARLGLRSNWDRGTMHAWKNALDVNLTTTHRRSLP